MLMRQLLRTRNIPLYEKPEAKPENIYIIIKRLLTYDICKDDYVDECLYLINTLTMSFKKGYELHPDAKIPKKLLFCVFRKFITCDNVSFRQSSFRALRHLIKVPEDILLFNNYFYPYLIIRTIDVAIEESLSNKNDRLDFEQEKAQVFKLIRKVVLIANGNNKLVHVSIIRSLLSLSVNLNYKNKSIPVCILILNEIAVLNSDLFFNCNGHSILIRCLRTCRNINIVESICLTILYLINHEKYRSNALLSLMPLISSYSQSKKINDDVKVIQLNSSRKIVLTVLKSWSGFVYFCDPKNESGLKSIIDTLLLEQVHLRVHVINLLYEIMSIEVPEWSDEYLVALSGIEGKKPKEAWKLRKKFLMSEGEDMLPHLGKNALDIININRALLLSAFLKTDLISKLVEIILGSDKFLSVRASILLGFVLHYARVLLPRLYQPDYIAVSRLLSTAITGDTNALASIHTLYYLQRIINDQKLSVSIFFDRLLHKSNSEQITPGLSTIRVNGILRKSCVLLIDDYMNWHWDSIQSVLWNLRGNTSWSKDLSFKIFFSKLVDFYKPSNYKYSQMVDDSSKNQYVIIVFDVIECLAKCANNSDEFKYLTELLIDIVNEINCVLNSDNVHNCLFSPKNMFDTLSGYYFLFIQHAYQYTNSAKFIDENNIWNVLSKLALIKNSDCYLKLILASLNYNDNISVGILNTIFESPIESHRFYATKFIKIIMRIRVKDFQDWGIKMLIDRLNDTSIRIGQEALQILFEASYDDVYSKSILKYWSGINEKISDKCNSTKHLILAKVLSYEKCLSCFDMDFIVEEIQFWCQKFCNFYTLLMEAEVHNVFMPSFDHEKTEVYIKYHLFGTLSQFPKGFTILMVNAKGFLKKSLQRFFTEFKDSDTYEELLELKSILWIYGHMSRSYYGIRYLIELKIIEHMIKIAETHPVFSIRGTAFYTLCIVASTPKGTDYLEKCGWVSIRHGRMASFPLYLPPSDTLKLNYIIGKNSNDVDISNTQSTQISLKIEYPYKCFDEYKNLSPMCCLEENGQNKDSFQLPEQYMGFCLPQNFQSLFYVKEPYKFKTVSDQYSSQITIDFICGHSMHVQLKCCSNFIHNTLTENDKNLRLNIIKSIVTLANPKFDKESKEFLLQLRQQNSEFRDIFENNFCLFAAVCWNLTQINYPTISRQFLQDLFLDNKLTVIHQDIQNIIKHYFW